MTPIQRRFAGLLFCLLPIFLTGCDRSPVDRSPPDRPEPAAPVDSATVDAPVDLPDRDQLMESAMLLIRAGDTDKAGKKLSELLIADPEDTEAIFRLALLRAESGNYRDAIELLDSIPTDHPEAGMAALGQAADMCMAIEQYDLAEQKYRRVLELAGDVPVAHRQLAYLYNRQGRRHEAAVHLRALCRLGNIHQDELHALMVLGHAISHDPNQPPAGPRPYYPIGPSATARMLYTANRHIEAVETLDESVRSGEAVPSIVAFYGLLSIEAQDRKRFKWWLTQTDDSARQFAEYWAAIGAYLVSEGRFEEAIRALGEALTRDPTNIAAMQRMHQSLKAVGKSSEADRWLDRISTQREVTLASNAIARTATPDVEHYSVIAKGLDQLHRPLEAMTWRMFKAFHQKASEEEMKSLNQQRTALYKSEQAFPDRKERVCGLNLKAYPLPTLKIPDAVDPPSPNVARSIAKLPTPQFENISDSVGLNHTYRIASQPQSDRFALYQTLGGGIAALDYDLDGWVDVHLAQGDADPPSFVGQSSNLLYRNLDGKVDDVTEKAGLKDNRYTVGLTSGDWNQDGFPDLVVANIGNKILLINNGDGTFQSRTFDLDSEHQVLTSSVALADLSGDALPDLYSVHYVEDRKMQQRPAVNEKGEILTASVASYQPGIDSIAINDGSGKMQHQMVSVAEKDASSGLGVVINDWDGEPGNEIFVGNDIRANQLWKRSSDQPGWVDTAAIRGCAVGVGGVQTASMGIAVGDFDGNGLCDLHVTNFYLEPVSLFMNRGGIFQDRCVQYRLHRPSTAVLGFGCQTLDYNQDGRPDVAVTNGNIEKAPGEPLQQPPQLFANLGDRFELSDVADPSGYWQGKHLGRGMARLDFNQDGKQDLVITHLDSPTALLINRTKTDHHWLAVQLVGVESEREAIGAQVDVYAGDQQWTNWMVGGDGYLCRNESVVPFGLGDVSDIDRIVVTWPDGQRQTFLDPPVNQRILIVENDPQVFPLGGDASSD